MFNGRSFSRMGGVRSVSALIDDVPSRFDLPDIDSMSSISVRHDTDEMEDVRSMMDSH
jgi:hypothetical protein